MLELTMLGTGNAAVTQCYNTCFTISSHGKHFLVDAGGGNGILRQLELARISLHDIECLMITHAHTDHILGCVWVVRYIADLMKKGEYSGVFPIYAHNEALHILEWICHKCLPPKLIAYFETRIKLYTLEAGDCFRAIGLTCRCFDTGSTKTKQFGFELHLPDGQRLVCLGDEPMHECNRTLCQGADWLLCEAFCLARDADIFKPYEKNHSTALDAGRVAQELNIRNLILYHTEDKNLQERKERYQEEVTEHFSGQVFIPDDLERIELRASF
ncbi:MAG: MBL fold metallo-hydrolase [Akkermansia sp.]